MGPELLRGPRASAWTFCVEPDAIAGALIRRACLPNKHQSQASRSEGLTGSLGLTVPHGFLMVQIEVSLLPLCVGRIGQACGGSVTVAIGCNPKSFRGRYLYSDARGTGGGH